MLFLPPQVAPSEHHVRPCWHSPPPRSSQVLCAFDHDVGTGTSVNGGCVNGEPSLQAALRTQARAHADWSYNEVVVGALYWEEHLPDVIEAVVFVRAEGEAKARSFHRAFMSHFSLSAAQVPLLRYDGRPNGFEDVS